MSLIVALGFLTALPLPRAAARPDQLARSLAWFPLVGAVVGAGLLALDAGLALALPVGVRSALVVIATVAITRGLHLDGLMDTCDGLFGGFTPERRLAIMRDSRVGAFGVLGGASDLLLRFAALGALTDGWRVAGLLLPPVIGRWAMVWATVAYPYARAEGLGAAFKAGASWRVAALATLGAAAICGMVWWPWGLVALPLGWLATVLVARFLLRRLPGLTGDCYGAVNELVEGLALVLIVGLAACPVS